MPNIELLDQTLAHIEANPDLWNQSTWHCGTAACFAGNAAILHGAQWAYPSETTLTVVDAEGSRMFVDDYATKALELEPGQAGALFHPNNKLEDLRRVIAQIKDGDIFENASVLW